jgi:hypothetical protein
VDRHVAEVLVGLRIDQRVAAAEHVPEAAGAFGDALRVSDIAGADGDAVFLGRQYERGSVELARSHHQRP